MNVFKRIETYLVALAVGSIAHWSAAHPGSIDPFYTGTLIGVILHALHEVPGGVVSMAPPRVGGSV